VSPSPRPVLFTSAVRSVIGLFISFTVARLVRPVRGARLTDLPGFFGPPITGELPPRLRVVVCS
jgi:hypothetical protein